MNRCWSLKLELKSGYNLKMLKIPCKPCPSKILINTRFRNLFVILAFTTLFFLSLNEVFVNEMNSEDFQQRRDYSSAKTGVSYKTLLPGQPPARRAPKILLYTTFFGEMKWYEESKHVYETRCPAGCTLTNDRSQISSADAVIYHLSDIAWQSTFTSGFRYKFPKYRHPNQVWILFNLEPLTMVWGDMKQWQGIFNWTWSYTRNSDVHSPYGSFKMFDFDEKNKRKQNKTLVDYDYFGAKSADGAVAMISHCTDEARRYRVIEKLKQYIPVRVIGKCGEGCPDGYMSCNDEVQKYKFYIAFENSDCVDYVSEKYWRSLIRGQIPIVAWRVNMDDIVVPGSYINVYDFPDLDSAGRYIQEVNRNAMLYNSYFRWQVSYSVNGQSGFCDLCHKLQDTSIPRQVYHDMDGWIMNNTCKPVTLSRYINRVFDRFKYDFRIH